MSTVGAPDVSIVVRRSVMGGENQSLGMPPRERSRVLLGAVAVGVLHPVGEMGIDEGEVRAFEHAFFVVRRFRARLVIAEVGDHESLG